MAENLKLAKALREAKSFLQGASNAAASNVSAPVDAIAWALRKAGVPVGDAPMGGSDWMRQKGLTAEAPGASGLIGESVGGVAPIVASAKAAQIAKGLLQAGENLAAPRMLNSQTGAIDIDALRSAFPSVEFDLSQKGNLATLDRLVVPKELRQEGLGTLFMGQLTKAADADNARLALSPSGDFGGNKTRLVDFYKRFGFVPNKGRNIDFTINQSMRREPLGTK